ncbi:Uncharacterised protein [Mycobacterium tuberculosis]|uniref:Uncharacterized protein n=1 Tax=Mycobacterium tuberculosis TaxID=1773 RepID=A0A0U0QGB5_MYCTX|nr:Uncharacterised protein [Mycobacterium tuberculosis]COV40136.1 Uncharacterised protein [Mycobacterium tuberculosis]
MVEAAAAAFAARSVEPMFSTSAAADVKNSGTTTRNDTPPLRLDHHPCAHTAYPDAAFDISDFQ